MAPNERKAQSAEKPCTFRKKLNPSYRSYFRRSGIFFRPFKPFSFSPGFLFREKISLVFNLKIKEFYLTLKGKLNSHFNLSKKIFVKICKGNTYKKKKYLLKIFANQPESILKT